MSNSGHETEINRAPALRISHIVYGRENTGNRVKYLVDQSGKGDRKEIPENVVLIRWRQRKMENHSFHGCRLSPNFWRAIGKAYGNDAGSISKLTPDALEKHSEIMRADAAEHHLKVPNSDVLHSIISALGSKKLQQILDRHLDPGRTERFGTPDLFLFAKKKSDTRVAFYRLVEVKKPKERVSNDQHEEIAFLRSIGVQARILRLIERQ
jgi:hypothetical protein